MDERRRHGLGDVLLAGEAWTLLGITRAMLLVVPFRRLMPALGMRLAPDTSAAAEPTQRVGSDTPKIGRVAWAIDAAVRRSPWEAKCLAQSLTGATMLRLRREPATVFFGVRPASAAENREMTAHSWLVSDGRIVTGAAGHEEYAVVAVYAPGTRKETSGT